VLIKGEVSIEFASVSAHPKAIISPIFTRDQKLAARISTPNFAKIFTDQRKNIHQTIASVPTTASVSQNASPLESYHCLQIA
jgi:hypothetical protein